MAVTIQKWGNSHGIRIPKIILEALHWDENDQLVINAESDRIIIEKANKRKTIEELFEGYDGNYVPAEIDWGSPRGEEVW